MKKSMVIALAAASCVIGSAAASAEVFTVVENGVVVASWEQSLAPTTTVDPSSIFTIPGSITTIDLTTTSWIPSTPGSATVTWYNAAVGGGFSTSTGLNFVGINFKNFPPVQYYSGSETAPIFVGGTFTGIDLGRDGTGKTVAGLTVSVPEPATWAMMLAGLGMVGFAVRRRRKVSVTYA